MKENELQEIKTDPDSKPREKRRKLGIRFKKQQAREWGWAMPALDGAELYDVETGEAFEGVTNLSVSFDTIGPIKAKLEIFVAAVDSYERVEAHLQPLETIPEWAKG